MHLADHTCEMDHNFGRAAASARLISTLRGSQKSSMESSAVPSPARAARSCVATLEGSSIEGNGSHDPREDLRLVEANKVGSPKILMEPGEAEPRLRVPSRHRVNLLLGGTFIIESMTILLSLTSYVIINRIATFNVEKIFFLFLLTWWFFGLSR